MDVPDGVDVLRGGGADSDVGRARGTPRPTITGPVPSRGDDAPGARRRPVESGVVAVQRRTAPSAPPVTSQRPAVPSRARSHRTAVTSSRWPWSVLAIAASAGSYTATVACAPKA